MGSEVTEHLIMKAVTGGAALIVVLVLGSYGYTWSESGRQEEEKNKWRDAHEKALDKRFDEVREGQKQLTEAVNKNNDKTTEVLMQILEEQRRYNQITTRSLR
jgi:hypothetical protein